MKFSPAGLQSDNGTEAGLIPQDLPYDIYAHWLGLRDKEESPAMRQLYTADNTCALTRVL